MYVYNVKRIRKQITDNMRSVTYRYTEVIIDDDFYQPVRIYQNNKFIFFVLVCYTFLIIDITDFTDTSLSINI